MKIIGAETYFDPAQIAQSGQCFRMEELPDGGCQVLAADRCLEMVQVPEGWQLSCGEAEFEEFWKNYFDLDTDYGKIIESIDKEDLYLQEAAGFGRGIRILRQDLWEMIITFLITQQNNIPRIRRCIRNICEWYGEKKETDRGKSYYAFPAPAALAGASEDELRACNLGYRGKYLIRTAKSIVNQEIDLEKIQKLDYPEAKKELLKLYGVGEKVADCICLFGLHMLEAFPVDTHIRQIVAEHYPEGFPAERYRGYEGVMQQYLFFYDLHVKKR